MPVMKNESILNLQPMIVNEEDRVRVRRKFKEAL